MSRTMVLPVFMALHWKYHTRPLGIPLLTELQVHPTRQWQNLRHSARPYLHTTNTIGTMPMVPDGQPLFHIPQSPLYENRSTISDAQVFQILRLSCPRKAQHMLMVLFQWIRHGPPFQELLIYLHRH